ncbi:MAG: stearoyl-CoA desaturase (delta-9 desaturase) [Candidatus Binatia bacterium]|jgi:stearoyl-CoA desaturase (delta-9 desaturase)
MIERSMTDQAPSHQPPINWATLLFIGGTTLTAALWPIHAWFYGTSLAQLLVAAAYFVSTGMAITVGYHRLIAHRTFKSHPWFEALLLIVGSAAWQGSALEWASDHVRHHAYTDTDEDPYNRTRGFWYSHIGWLLRKRDLDRDTVPEWLASNRLVVLQDRYYTPLAVITSFLIPLAVFGVGGLLLIGAVRLVAVHHVTWFINSWAHTGTHRPYNPRVSAVDNWFLAFFTFGEGWHNYHHAFPADYRNGIQALSWDPSKWLIWSMSKVGATYDLKRMSPAIVWRKRVETALGHVGSERADRVAATRQRLERLSETTLHNLRAAARRAGKRGDEEFVAVSRRLREIELPEFDGPDLQELRKHLTAAADHWREARDARATRRAKRMRELIDHLAAYRVLLDRLTADTADA